MLHARPPHYLPGAPTIMTAEFHETALLDTKVVPYNGQGHPGQQQRLSLTNFAGVPLLRAGRGAALLSD